MKLEEQIGDRIRRRRLFLGMSQTELGYLIGVSRVTIHRLEKSASWSPAKLERVARALDVDVRKLLNGK